MVRPVDLEFAFSALTRMARLAECRLQPSDGNHNVTSGTRRTWQTWGNCMFSVPPWRVPA